MIIVIFSLNITPGICDTDKIQLVAVGKDRAIVMINGERFVFTSENPAQGNHVMLSADSNQVVLEIEGNQVILRTDDVAAPILDEGEIILEENNNPVVLWSNSSGFFFARGKINGNSVNFLVDTGADVVTFSQAHADRLGINYQKGKSGYASTASGIAPLKSLKVSRMSIEHITLHNVLISVVLGNFPEVPLLGGSFLNKLNMSRVGNKMELSKR